MNDHILTVEDKKPIFNIPGIREYFVDLEFVLGVISDGPAKSFAFRRLQYLLGKFTMHSLLNEFHELTEMKVSFFSFGAMWKNKLISINLTLASPSSVSDTMWW